MLTSFAMALAAGFMFGVEHKRKDTQPLVDRLWQHIEDLETDKRALTESFCRRQVVSPVEREVIVSDGWWDSPPIVGKKPD
jgi:hypothetical protein